MKKCRFAMLILVLVLIAGCKTYHITTQSLCDQLRNSDGGRKVFVKGNGLDEVVVLNKNEDEIKLPVTPHMGVRIFKNDGSKVTFYFNTLTVADSAISGSRSSFVKISIKPVKLADIKKIELQR